MILRGAVVAGALAVSLSLVAPAGADPGGPVPGTPCATDLAGAMTIPSAAGTPLVCDGGGGRWAAVTDPYPVSDRWLSSGPAIELHGQGRRNPSMLSGDWLGTPIDTGRCHATQVAVVPGVAALDAPRVDDGEPGRPLSVQVAPTMATIELSGDCLWQKQTAQPGSGG